MMDAMTQNEQLIKKAIATSMDPNVSPEQRMNAYQVCEEFKESSPYLVPCGLLLCNKENDAVVRHFGLQLIEHVVKFRWNGMSDLEKVNLKTSVMQLASMGTLSIYDEQTYIKDGVARIIVEVAKRDWPQYWSTFVGDLHVLSRLGAIQTELMLYVYLRLVEDCVLFQNIPPKRRRDITMSFIQDMPDIFSSILVILEEHVTKYKELKGSGEESVGHEALAHCRMCQTALECLTGFLDWMHLGTMFSRDSLLVKILCVLLGDDRLQLTAAECLLMIVSRKGKQEDRAPLMVMFGEEAMSTILSAATSACNSDLDAYFYNFLKKLCQILMELGKQLCNLWGVPGRKVKCPKNFAIYLQAVLTFTKHPSLTLNIFTLTLWQSFFRHDDIYKNEIFISILPELLTICAQKLKKVGYPSRNDDKACDYSRLDYDNDVEYASSFANARNIYASLIRYLCKKYPVECFKLMDDWLMEQLSKPIQTAQEGEPTPPAFCDSHSPSYVQWEALSTFMDFVNYALVSAEPENPTKDQCLEFMAKCFQLQSQDPMVLSCQLSCVSACCSFVRYNSQVLTKVFEKVFECIEFVLPGLDKDAQPRSVKLVRKHGCSLLLKLCKEHGPMVYNIFKVVDSKIKSLFAENKLSQFERVAMLESLVLLSNQLLKYDKQTTYVRELLQSAQDVWFSAAIQHALSSAPAFMSYVGITDAAVTSMNNDEAGDRRRQIGYCVNSLVATIRRCSTPVDTADAELGEYLMESGPVTFKHPCFELLTDNIEGILSLIHVLNCLWEPQFQRLTHPQFSRIYELNDKEKLLLLGLDNQAVDVVIDKTDPANRTRGFIEDTFEMSFVFLALMAKNLGYQFYSIEGLPAMVCQKTIMSLNHSPDYRLRYALRHFLKAYITNCPSDLYEVAVIPILTAFYPFMLQRLTTSWEEMQKMLEEKVDNGTCEALEALSEVLLRSLTKEYIDLLLTACVTSHSNDSKDEPMGDDNKGHEVELSSLGEALMKSDECYPHVVLNVFNSLSWPDTVAVGKSVKMCVPIMKKMIEEDRVNEELSVYVMRCVLHGLEIHGKHENVEPLFTTLASNLYQLLIPLYPNLGGLLKQIPDVDLELVDTYNQMLNLPKHRRFPEKKRRDMFRRITANIIQVHTGQRFRREVEIKDLPPIFVKRKQKMHAESQHGDEPENGLSDLFNPEEKEEAKEESLMHAGGEVADVGEVAMEEETA